MCPDSPENKCPICGGTGKFGVDTWTLIPDPCLKCGGSGRIQASGVEPSKPGPEIQASGDFLGDDLSQEHSCHAGCSCQASGGKFDPEKLRDDGPDASSVDPQCPVQVMLTEAEADWLAASIAPESEVSATAQGIYDKVNLAIGSAPSPDRETGGVGVADVERLQIQHQAWRDHAYEEARKRLSGEGRLSPSAAPTNSGAGSRSDSEGEECLFTYEELQAHAAVVQKVALDNGRAEERDKWLARIKEKANQRDREAEHCRKHGEAAKAYAIKCEAGLLRSLLVPEEEA